MARKRSKAAQAEYDEARARLLEWIKPGDTVYTICDHVSSSGMSRAIRCVLLSCENGRAIDLHPNHAIGVVLGLSHWKRRGYTQDALVVSGCGMDMGFHLVNSLSYALYGEGYQCLGKGQCPSNYHVNAGYLEGGRAAERFDLIHTDGYALRHRWL